MPNALWFSLNRERGGPAYQWATNRTSARFRYNGWFLGVIIIAAVLLVILTLLAPTLKHRFKTIALVASSLFIGVILVLSSVLPDWQTGYTLIQASMKVHEPREQPLILGLHIGLLSANITLQSNCHRGNESPVCNKNVHRDINFNERVNWEPEVDMVDAFAEARRRGLPVPILTIFDYFQFQDGGFHWSSEFRTAGYYAYFVLVTTIALWAITNILFLVVPRYATVSLTITGALSIITVLVYWSLLPSHHLVVHISGEELMLEYGWCYWAVLIVGIGTSIAGGTLFYFDLKMPGVLSTDLNLKHKRRIARLSKKQDEKMATKQLLKPKISVIDSTANVDNEHPNLEKLRDLPPHAIKSESSFSKLILQETDSTSPTDAPQNKDGSGNTMDDFQGRDPFVLAPVIEDDQEKYSDQSSSSESDWAQSSSSDDEVFKNEESTYGYTNEAAFPDLGNPDDEITPRRRPARIPSLGSHHDFFRTK